MQLLIESNYGNFRNLRQLLRLKVLSHIVGPGRQLRFDERGVGQFGVECISHYRIIITMKIALLALCLWGLLPLVSSESYCGKYNCYELLGVSQTADEQTIRKAYREMARRYHPDRNREEDTRELFQWINKAHETLTDEKSRFKYDLHLQNPEESEYYHEYRYYSHKYIQNPQIPLWLVISVFFLLVSLLHFVIRRQMYQRALLHITEGQDFKNKLNERCGGNKKLKDEVRDEMLKEVQIQGGYSDPTWRDVVAVRLLMFPWTFAQWIGKQARWIYKYGIKKQEYTAEDRLFLTLKALNLTAKRWENVDPTEQTTLLSRSLWIKANMKQYQDEAREKWLAELKQTSPKQYQHVLRHLKKTQ